MSIITISRSSCSKGKLIAESVAENLNLSCLSREVLMETAEQYHVPQPKLMKALHDGPRLVDHFSAGKERYIAMIKATLLNRLKQGEIVYHGLAGHFLVKDVPQVLKVRIIADMEDRVAEIMQRDTVSDIVARARLSHEDKERASWSRHFCKMPPLDSELYDLVINLKEISLDKCVTLICDTVGKEKFQFTDAAKKKLEDLAFAATIKATLVKKYDNAIVTSRSGKVFIRFPQPVGGVEKTKGDIENMLTHVNGIHNIHYDIKSNTLPRTAMHK